MVRFFRCNSLWEFFRLIIKFWRVLPREIQLLIQFPVSFKTLSGVEFGLWKIHRISIYQYFTLFFINLTTYSVPKTQYPEPFTTNHRIIRKVTSDDRVHDQITIKSTVQVLLLVIIPKTQSMDFILISYPIHCLLFSTIKTAWSNS